MNSALPVRGGKSSLNTGAENGVSVQADLSSPEYSLPFFYYMTIPKSTPIATPLTYHLSLPNGVINRVWVEFPKGCSGLAGLQVFRGVRQIFPLPEGNWLRSDNSVMNFSFTHVIKTVPFEVEIRGYNVDDTFQHVLWIAFEMRGQSKDVPPQLAGLLDYLKG